MLQLQQLTPEDHWSTGPLVGNILHIGLSHLTKHFSQQEACELFLLNFIFKNYQKSSLAKKVCCRLVSPIGKLTPTREQVIKRSAPDVRREDKTKQHDKAYMRRRFHY